MELNSVRRRDCAKRISFIRKLKLAADGTTAYILWHSTGLDPSLEAGSQKYERLKAGDECVLTDGHP